MGTVTTGRETAGVTIRLVIRYVRAHAGDGAVDELLALAGETRPLSALEDERNWSTYAQRIALFRAAATVLGDPEVGRHIGEWVLNEQIGLPIRMVLLALGSPKQLFKNAEKASTKFSTVSDLRCVSATATSARLIYQLHEGYEPDIHDCGYSIGLLSQVPALFGLPAGTVVHTECQVRGGTRCVYDVSWPKRTRFRGSKNRLRRLEEELRHMTVQVESLQHVASDIVAARTIEETINRVIGSSRRIVGAEASMLFVRPLVGGEPVLRGEGLSAEEEAALGDVLRSDHPTAPPGCVIVDIASGRRNYGRLAVVGSRTDSFFDAERRMIAAFAGLAASALDAIVSTETTRVLSELAQSLADITNSDQMCQRIADALPLVIGSPVAAVACWNPNEEVLQFVGVRGFPDDMASALKSVVVRPSDTPHIFEQLANPAPMLWVRELGDPFVSSLLDAFSVEAAMSVPIMARGSLLGHVIAGWYERPLEMYMDELIERMAGVAGQAAAAMENARLLDQTTYQALHDPLTGLPNRVLLDDRLQQAAARARRDQSAAAVLLVDLDGFKDVNDSFGHRAGDEVLRQVANRLRGLLRDADTASRLGGDEFVLICNGAGGEDVANAIAHRVETALAAPIQVDGGTVHLGASVGVAMFDGSDPELLDVLGRADAAMYEVKRTRPKRSRIRR